MNHLPSPGSGGPGTLVPKQRPDSLTATQPSQLAPAPKDRASEPQGATSHVSLVQSKAGLWLQGINKGSSLSFDQWPLYDSRAIKGTFLHFLNQLLCVLGLCCARQNGVQEGSKGWTSTGIPAG